MARISTYNIDENVVALDKWIGTRADGSITKNFSAQGIADFLNNTSAVTIAGQNNFLFQTNLSEGRAPGTISFTNGGGSNTAFASLTTIKISKYANSGYVVLDYMLTLVGQAVFIAQTDNVNNFGIYKLLALDQDIEEPYFYNATFEVIQSHGALLMNNFYAFSVYPGFVSYPFVQTLQSVTDSGNTTTNDIILNNTPGEYGDYIVVNTIQDLGMFNSFSSPTSENYTSYYAGYGFGLNASFNTLSTSIYGYESSFYVHSDDSGNIEQTGTIGFEGTDGYGSPYLSLTNKLGKEGKLKVTNILNDNVTLQFPDKPTGEYTIATTEDVGVTPALQQVLDNNHDLVNNNNFQGTLAGLNNTGVSINAFGNGAAQSNSGSYVNTFGDSAGDGNIGNYVNAFGISSGYGNTKDNLNAFGLVSGQLNSGENVNAFGLAAGYNNQFNNVNLFGVESYADANNQNVFSKWINYDGGITTRYLGRLSFNDITTDRKWELPDASGTIALTSQIPTIGTWGALNYPTWTTGTPFVKMTAAGTFALDTNTYLTSAVTSVGATGPITSSGGNTPTISTSMSTNKLIGRTTSGTGVMEEISIGTGLTLSAGTLSNSATYTSPLTTKGDIFVRNATVDTRLPVGSNDQVLVADSTQATGLKWAAQSTPTALGYYGAFQDNTIQTAVAINTPYAMKFGITDLSNGVTIVSDGSNLTRVTIANTGIYNIQFSAQFDRTNSGTDSVDIWLRKNGVDVPGSGGKIVLSGSATASQIIATWNYVLNVVGGDYYQLMWSTPDTHVRLLYEAAQTSPFAHPIIPSVILTVTQQSGIMAGTGITAINSLTGATQTLTTGTTGTDFAIVDSGVDHKFNLPTASATARGALSNTDWTTFNSKQAALSYTPFKYINTTQSTVTGTTAETIVATATIAGGSFNSSDIMKLLFEVTKAITISNVTLRIKINTTNTLTGATNIALFTFALANLYTMMQRNFSLNGGNLIGYSFNVSLISDINSNATASTTSTSLNTANPLYIFFTIQLGNTADSATFIMGNITN